MASNVMIESIIGSGLGLFQGLQGLLLKPSEPQMGNRDSNLTKVEY
jgi:hypothetical protein